MYGKPIKTNKEPKAKKCKQCSKLFTPLHSLQSLCSSKCEYEQKKAKAKEKENKPMIKAKVNLSKPEKLLEAQINAIVRLIDKGQKCISCDNEGTQAGHFHSVQSNGTLRYHLDNIHLQCTDCNITKSDNKEAYKQGLEQRYNALYLEKVESTIVRENPLLKLYECDYEEIIQEAKKIVKELSAVNLVYPSKMRLKLRETYNQRLKIYV